MSANSYNIASPAQLRHSLRTPLNHIIGYSEMLVEELEDGVEAGHEDALVQLNAVLFNARELVRFIQNALPAGKPELSGSEVRDLQLWLHPHLVDLTGTIGLLVAANLPNHAEDIGRVRSAAERMLAFTVGNSDALEDVNQGGESPASTSSRSGGARILVIDDNNTNRDILRRGLERDGYAVELCSGGETGLAAMRAQRYDLVLLDVLMPGRTGFEVLNDIKSSPTLAATPVIMLSALDEASSVIRCIEMGAEDYFMKPFDPVLLRTRIRAALDRSRLRASLAAMPSFADRAASLAESAAALACAVPSEEAKRLAVELTDLAAQARRMQPA